MSSFSLDLNERDSSSPELLAEVEHLVDLAIAEDIGKGDITTNLSFPHDTFCTATIRTREQGVISGTSVAESVFLKLPGNVSVQQLIADGSIVEANAKVLSITGSAATVLSGERTALNFLSHLSGIATLTRKYVNAVGETSTTILDTRKTTPGMRHLEKYAVRCGGGTNHRNGLYDAILIKDNHIYLSQELPELIARIRTESSREITVEIESLDQIPQVLDAGVDRILLDNMEIPILREAVQQISGRALTEASGGVNIETVKAIAETGVDFISVGSLTHSAPALDISLDILG